MFISFRSVMKYEVAMVLGIIGMLCFSVTRATTIPFYPHRGIVEVDVLLEGHIEGRFGIDTGADRLYINRDFAERNDMSLGIIGQQRKVVGIKGTSDAQSVAVHSLAIGDERLYDLVGTAIDIPSLIEDTSAGHPDGLIGYDILRRFYVTVDFPASRLEMYSHEPTFFGSDTYSTTDFDIKRNKIIVDVIINDSIPVPMLLDYCASYSAVTPELATRIDLTAKAGQVARVSQMRVGNSLATSNVAVTVSDLSRLYASLRGRPFEGIIGYTFLYHHKITIDYRRSRIYVHGE
ncbi:MAG: pepsin/retropepsin-like aspartic protease family protein [Candidatus Zixiibacteriota bacterium]